MSRSLRSHRDDRGVVAIEFVLVMPFIIALIACSITLAGLFQTKSRVVGAARDWRSRPGAQARGERSARRSEPHGRHHRGPRRLQCLCPPLTNPAYQSATPPQVIAEASKTYTVDVPFVGTWTDIVVTEKATMPCG